MSEYYSPNAKGTGAALFMSFASKDGAVYCKFVKQTSWDAQRRKGTFKDGKVLNFKLSQDEAGALIEAVRNKARTDFFHQFDNENTTGSFSYYRIEPKTPKDKVKEGFGFSVKRGEDEYKVGFTLGAAERFMEFLKFALNHIFSAEYAARKKRDEEYFKAKEDAATNAAKNKNTKKVKTPDPEPEPASDFEDGETSVDSENEFADESSGEETEFSESNF